MAKTVYKNRIGWVDVAKGYGILLVVLGHIGFGRFNTWIYSFHMPLFVFLSGYVFKEYSFSVFLRKKAKSLLIPYLILSVVAYLTSKDGLTSAEFLYYALTQKRFDFIWFLSFLFVLDMIYYVIITLFKKDWAIILATAVLVAIWYCTRDRALDWNIDAALFSSPFFAAGYLFKRRKVIKEKNNWTGILAFGFLLINIAMAFLNRAVSGENLDVYAVQYGFIPLTYLAAFAGIMFIVCLSKITDFGFLKYIGKNSIIYYGLHTALSMPIAKSILENFGIYEGEGLACLAYKGILFVLIIALTTVFAYIVNLSKEPFYNKKS